jgi:hypothetical protein
LRKQSTGLVFKIRKSWSRGPICATSTRLIMLDENGRWQHTHEHAEMVQTDLCRCQGSQVHITDTCTVQTRAHCRHVHMQTRAHSRHVHSADTCTLQTRAHCRHVHTADTCTVQTRATVTHCAMQTGRRIILAHTVQEHMDRTHAHT